MLTLDKMPGEQFPKDIGADSYLMPRSVGQRRPNVRHKVFEEPAVAAWREMDAARRKTCEDLGIERTHGPRPHRKRKGHE